MKTTKIWGSNMFRTKYVKTPDTLDEKFYEAQRRYKTARFSWTRDNAFKLMERLAGDMIKAEESAGLAKYHYNVISGAELPSHIANNAKQKWLSLETIALNEANNFDDAYRVYAFTLEEKALNRTAYVKLLQLCDTIHRARLLYGAQETHDLKDRALTIWRELSDQQIAQVSSFDATTKAMEESPHVDKDDVKRNVSAVYIALERCLREKEVAKWLIRFGEYGKNYYVKGAQKLLELASQAIDEKPATDGSCVTVDV